VDWRFNNPQVKGGKEIQSRFEVKRFQVNLEEIDSN